MRLARRCQPLLLFLLLLALLFVLRLLALLLLRRVQLLQLLLVHAGCWLSCGTEAKRRQTLLPRHQLQVEGLNSLRVRGVGGQKVVCEYKVVVVVVSYPARYTTEATRDSHRPVSAAAVEAQRHVLRPGVRRLLAGAASGGVAGWLLHLLLWLLLLRHCSSHQPGAVGSGW